MTSDKRRAKGQTRATNLQDRTARIRELNDAFRRHLIGGKFMITSGVTALGAPHMVTLVSRVREFTDFSADNDPYGEHDFGAFEEAGQRFFWKIDYFDRSMKFGSEDPADLAKTTRVLTLMLADEY